MVVIIDYGMGNLFSVENAFRVLKAEIKVSSEPKDLKSADQIVLPGVGAFPDGMKNLQVRGLISAIQEEVLKNKKPFLGICLGMQLLASEGEEHQLTPGLDLISGRVRRFKVEEEKFRIPHIGWNDVGSVRENLLFKDILQPVFYFVHSYHFVPKDSSLIAGTCDYGEIFAAAVQKDNIFGVQFHPEKSQREGLKILENFLKFK